MPTVPKTHTEIGAFEAKTRLSEILRKVEQGERFTITRNGQPIADLVPTEGRMRRAREEAMQRLMNPPVRGVSGDTVLAWIREGRE
jgi:prevent-host-death family protein